MTYPPHETPPDPAFPPVEAYRPPGAVTDEPAQAAWVPPAPWTGPWPAPYPPPGYQYVYVRTAPPVDSLAIASLVVSCVATLGVCAWGFGGVVGVVGAILGHVSRRRIRRTGAAGGGMALAGIIVGWVVSALAAVAVTFLIVMVATDGTGE